MEPITIAIILAGFGFLVSLFIIVDAFRDELWKGFFCLCCDLYLLYYAFAEYDHDQKWLIVLGWLVPTLIAAVIANSAGR